MISNLTKDEQNKLLAAFEESFSCQRKGSDKNKLVFSLNSTGQYLAVDAVAKMLQLEFKRSERPFTLQEVADWLEDFQNETLKTLNCPAYSKPKKIFNELGEAASWIYEQLKVNKDCPIKISDRGDTIEFVSDGVRINGNDKLVRAWLTSKVHDLGLQKIYREGILDAGWLLLKQKFQTVTKAEKNSLVKYDGSKFVDEFLKYIYDYLQIKEDYDVYEMIFKHWMWCLKRRMFDRPVVWHIWINFAGAQGIGKTQMINRMFNFLSDFKADTTLRIMNDLDREYRKFTDNYIIFFDELNTGDNSDSEILLYDGAVDAIKQIMTQETFTVRQFQTQDQNKVRNTFVPISCANKHLYDIIYDGDAMRRWFEFNCQRNTPPESYDELNAILERFPEALKGIDENNDKGYWIKGSATDKKIVEIQKHYIPTNTSTNTWIDYCGIKPDYEKNQHTSLLAPEYKQYCTYCRAVGKHAAGLQRVTMILGRLWPDCIDDKGIAHVVIEKRVDEGNGELILNDPIKFDGEVVNDDTEDLIKEWSDEPDYTPTKKVTKGLF